MKILTLNVRSWYRDTCVNSSNYWRNRASKIEALIEREQPDVILFQEMLWPMTCYIPDGYKCAGFSISHHIYIKKEYKAKRSRFRLHYAMADVEIEGRTIRFASVHSRWDAKTYIKVSQQLNEQLKGVCIWGGDWNVEPVYMANYLLPQDIASCGKKTFINWETHKSAELDYFAVPGSIFEVKRLEDVGSDHSPVMLTICE